MLSLFRAEVFSRWVLPAMNKEWDTQPKGDRRLSQRPCLLEQVCWQKHQQGNDNKPLRVRQWLLLLRPHQYSTSIWHYWYLQSFSSRRRSIYFMQTKTKLWKCVFWWTKLLPIIPLAQFPSIFTPFTSVHYKSENLILSFFGLFIPKQFNLHILISDIQKLSTNSKNINPK